MIKLEKMSAKQTELDLIAEWRNQSMISLRSNDLTAKGQAQTDWVNGFTAKEKYYFIYDKTIKISTIDTATPTIDTATRFIGYCGLDKIDPVNGTAEMGLLISPREQNDGYGAEAVRKLLMMGFADFNLNCIFIEVIGSTNNWDFWLKQGFLYEGSLRARHFKNGMYYQSRVGSIIRDDWFESSMIRKTND